MVESQDRFDRIAILLQKQLDKVVVLFSNRKLDFGFLTVDLLARLLMEDSNLRTKIKEIFGVEYNFVRFWEQQQPPYRSDIELYKDDRLVLKFNVKATTRRDITPTLRRLCGSLKDDEIALLAFPLQMVKGIDESIIVAMSIFTKKLCKTYTPIELVRQIDRAIQTKRIRKKLDNLQHINLDEVSTLETLRLNIETKDLILALKIDMNNQRMVLDDTREKVEENRETIKRLEKTMERLENKVESNTLTIDAVRKKLDTLDSKLDLILKLMKKKKEEENND